MNYIKYIFSNLNLTETKEILVAFLDQCGYSGFEEENDSLTVYIEEENRDEKHLDEIINSIPGSEKNITFQASVVPDINWNKKWESEFQSITVDDQVLIRASFHEANSDKPYEIIINPKMSFGTGHHETTRMMIRGILEVEMKGKDVLDVGTGSGVLAILCSMRGAGRIHAIDTDKWAYNNAKENVEINRRENIQVLNVGVFGIPGEEYDIILANINRNIILEQLKKYAEIITNSGLILISGFLEADRSVIIENAAANGLKVLSDFTEGKWVALLLGS